MTLIEEEYQCDKKLRRQDVKSLMDWAQTQPHLPEVSEQEAIWFIKSCYYSNEFAKTTLDTFYSFRHQERDLFHVRSKETWIRSSKVGLVSQVSTKTQEGDSVYFLHLIDPNPDHFEINDLINLADAVIMLGLHLFGTHDGLQVVIDMTGFSLSHLPKINVMVLKKALIYIQQAIPVRLKGVHFININNKTFLDMLLALAKPFMDKKLIDMLHLHSSLNDFKKFLPLECLPKDYGGQEDSLECLQEKMISTVLENITFLEYLDKQKVDESKRPEDSKLPLEVFGVSGTFKKLDFD